MLLILDRIEDGIAVLTDIDGKIYECPSYRLPDGVHENSALEADITVDGEISELKYAANPNAGLNERRLKELFHKK